MPAGTRFAQVWREPKTHARLCVLFLKREPGVPWVTQSIAQLALHLSKTSPPVYSSSLYRILQGRTKRGRTADVTSVRRLATLDELNAAVEATGCRVFTKDATLWEIDTG